ncbi:hypothetical protein [Caballeronia sp. Lep1P3]|uniref:hypothetical protein n=1 Tax=Caballeronia sp. Lep1P3 TaxID=2878150 RepID=UPI001FD2B998|nr:hypothetical protein [Caballeronia sp. Lep1P3]
MLVAIAPRSIGRLAHLVLMLRGATGRLSHSGHVDAFTFDRIPVTRPTDAPGKRRRAKSATDNEVARLDMPLEFRVRERRLLLLKPEPAVAEAHRS